jgi:cyclopropane-fatty-acyl-phospholipid synthase
MLSAMSLTETMDADQAFSWRAPALRGAPAAFRTALKVAAETWQGPPLALVLPSGQAFRLKGSVDAPEVKLIINDFRFIRRILASGDIGFAEGFIEGDWDTPDLSALLEAFSENFDGLAQLMTGNPFARALSAISHALNRNSRRGARRNIHAHYDLGNAFYGRWLDPSMTYSSALFTAPDLSLEAAQREKYAALARAIGVQPSHQVLEIGCGWGGFAEFVGREIGARVQAITISKAQHDYARRRIFEAGLAETVDIRLVDYRDVEGAFDRIASIEMFEAVGEAYWPTYFGRVAERLKPGGLAGLQIITIADRLFDEYSRRPDFIQRYIFPGGMLPSETRLKAETSTAGLEWVGVRRFAADYARTLRAWADAFEQNWDGVRGLGFDERFRRLWLYYLGYCEAGFRTGRTDVIQLALAKG